MLTWELDSTLLYKVDRQWVTTIVDEYLKHRAVLSYGLLQKDDRVVSESAVEDLKSTLIHYISQVRQGAYPPEQYVDRTWMDTDDRPR